MDNPIEYISSQILSYFVKKNGDANGDGVLMKVPPFGLDVFKFHSGKLSQNGEITLISNIKYWIYFCKKYNLELRDEAYKLFQSDNKKPIGDDKELEIFMKIASNWALPVRRIEPHLNGRCSLYFQRVAMKQNLIRLALYGTEENKPYGFLKKNCHKFIRLNSMQLGCVSREESLADFRARTLAGILKRVLIQSSWNLINELEDFYLESDNGESDTDRENLNKDMDMNEKDVVILNVRSFNFRSEKRENIKDQGTFISVGPVLEPGTKKISQISASAYEGIRSNDMHLLALHKYGIRPTKSMRPMDMVKRLGAAAVIVDMFEVRQKGAVVLIRNGVGCSKGASFILYNSSRLETLLRSFDELVKANKMTPLPDYKDIDMSLLKEDDEWNLVFGYLLRYPNLIEACTEQIAQGEFGIHLLVRYINNLVATFSGYYRRSRILITRPNLMATVHARIYLLKAVRHVLNNALLLLGIEPMPVM